MSLCLIGCADVRWCCLCRFVWRLLLLVLLQLRRRTISCSSLAEGQIPSDPYLRHSLSCGCRPQPGGRRGVHHCTEAEGQVPSDQVLGLLPPRSAMLCVQCLSTAAYERGRCCLPECLCKALYVCCRDGALTPVWGRHCHLQRCTRSHLLVMWSGAHSVRLSSNLPSETAP